MIERLREDAYRPGDSPRYLPRLLPAAEPGVEERAGAVVHLPTKRRAHPVATATLRAMEVTRPLGRAMAVNGVMAACSARAQAAARGAAELSASSNQQVMASPEKLIMLPRQRATAAVRRVQSALICSLRASIPALGPWTWVNPSAWAALGKLRRRMVIAPRVASQTPNKHEAPIRLDRHSALGSPKPWSRPLP